MYYAYSLPHIEHQTLDAGVPGIIQDPSKTHTCRLLRFWYSLVVNKGMQDVLLCIVDRSFFLNTSGAAKQKPDTDLTVHISDI